MLRRLLFLPLGLFVANWFGYVYAYTIGPVQRARDPYAFGTVELPPVIGEYWEYLQKFVRFDWGIMPNNEPVLSAIGRASLASLVLVFLALALSAALGILLGVRAARSEPPRVAAWLTALATIGLASPSFYIGILFISVSVMYVIYGASPEPLLPFQGFGWDAHLVLPTLALAVRPMVQIAQVTSSLLVGELGKQYVVAARSMGNSMKVVRRHHAFRNIAAPVILTVAGSVRLLVAELIIIERLFGWPGLGRLLSSVLVITNQANNFYYPPLLAGLLTVIVAIFLLSDLIAAALARALDPRLRHT